jgi:nitrite reductase (NADH) small subunit
MTATVVQLWQTVCRIEELLPERGVCALIDGVQVAVFRTFDDELHAVGNFDPISGAMVLSRGIVGTRQGSPTVASPVYKQAFDLTTGECLDADGVWIPVYSVRRTGDEVEVSLRCPT